MQYVIDGLAVLGAIWVVKLLLALARASIPVEEAAPAPVAVKPAAPIPTPSPVETQAANDDIAVIAAAVSAYLGGNRIVHIEDLSRGATWSAEGRWLHQISHGPRSGH
jgi:hypothetical protein